MVTYRFVPSQANDGRRSPGNEQSDSHPREFYIQIATASLERERRTVQIPADVDPDYIRFQEELKEKLTSKGDECIWRALEKLQDLVTGLSD